jgi:acyl-CoA thioesterase
LYPVFRHLNREKHVLNTETAELALAKACSEHMYRDDRCSQMLGMTVEESSPGYARLNMRVRKEMLNGYGNCHGGMIFTLADSAFAHACNTRNHVSVAVSCQVEFLVAVTAGQILIAEAVEQYLQGKNGVYDVRVKSSDDTLVALFRGKSRAIGGVLVTEATVDTMT